MRNTEKVRRSATPNLLVQFPLAELTLQFAVDRSKNRRSIPARADGKKPMVDLSKSRRQEPTVDLSKSRRSIPAIVDGKSRRLIPTASSTVPQLRAARSDRRAGPQGVGAQFHRRDGRAGRLRHARAPRGRERAVPGLFRHRGEAVRGAQGERGRPQAVAARARRAPGRRAVHSLGVQHHRLRPGVRPVLGGLRRVPPGPRHETQRAPCVGGVPVSLLSMRLHQCGLLRRPGLAWVTYDGAPAQGAHRKPAATQRHRRVTYDVARMAAVHPQLARGARADRRRARPSRPMVSPRRTRAAGVFVPRSQFLPRICTGDMKDRTENLIEILTRG
jgi:hypothetical protein